MSRMQLPELQQYATLHKNDPYIVTLALSIANQKKQMMASKDGQAGMQPQPKVVDQDIAQMAPTAPHQMMPPSQQGMPPPQQQQQQQTLPEDQGIGQLPAPNMQGMAAGGIVAFGPGGSTGEDNTPAWLKALPPESGLRRIYESAKQYDKNNPQPLSPQEAYLKSVKDNPSNSLPAGTTFTPPGMPAAQTGAIPAPAPTPTPVAGTPAASAPPPTAGLVNPVAPPSTTSSLNTKPMTAEEAMTASQKFGDETALKAGIAKLDTDAVNSNAAIQAASEKGLAALAKPGAEAEARLKAREAQDVVGQADAKAMAIFKAGLGMMAGTSQYAFENIGKGAMAGLEDYSSSIKEFRKLGIERDKAYADIEAARNAAARDDFKTSIGLQEKGADRLARAHEKGIDLTASLFKTDKETASTIYRDSFDQAQQNQRTQTTEAGATGRTLIQERGANARTAAGLPSTLYSQLGAAQEGSPLLKGYNIAKNEGSMERLFESYNKLANDPLNGTYFKAQHPTFESYVRDYQSGIGTGGGSGFVNQLPANAPVLKPK